jgi:hypothetical protein
VQGDEHDRASGLADEARRHRAEELAAQAPAPSRPGHGTTRAPHASAATQHLDRIAVFDVHPL